MGEDEICGFTGTSCRDCPSRSCFYADPPSEDEEYDIEVCDYTGEECFGDKMFCEECPVLTDE